jgi:hypothetical protein
MAGLDPAIQAPLRRHRYAARSRLGLDGRVKPGHDAVRANSNAKLSADGVKLGHDNA